MARMYPSVVHDFHNSQGEKLVYEALSTLNNDYTVFYSYRWLGTKQQYRSEGEADFLVLHPRKGILSIEVKAGGISFRDGLWIQTNRLTGEEKVIDPLGQAAESQHRVHNIIRARFGGQFRNYMIGRAVWFTSVHFSEKVPLPPEVSKEIVLDESALDSPKEALDGAFEFWQDNMNKRQELDSGEFNDVIKLLMPTFKIAESISSYAKTEKASYVQLTKRQGAVLDFLQEQPMAAIHGPAGTGKTLLAVQKAKMLAEQGQKVLYLCFNEFLLDHLRSSDYDREHITFHNVRTLAEELMKDSSIPLSEVIPAFEEFFAKEYDDEEWPYSNIVVDEGQDISDQILAHLAFLAEVNDGIFYVFYDRNQYIMQRKKPEWIEKNAECRLVLYKNCRNTAEIGRMAGEIIGLKLKSYVNEVHGLPPQMEYYKDEKQLWRIAEKFVREMLEQGMSTDDFVVLTVRSVQHSLLKADKLCGFPVSETQEKGKVRFTSVRKFKGLEAKAVLLIDAQKSKIDDALQQRIMYVGCSRANTYLLMAIMDDID